MTLNLAAFASILGMDSYLDRDARPGDNGFPWSFHGVAVQQLMRLALPWGRYTLPPLWWN